jgi:hypothetical protein
MNARRRLFVIDVMRLVQNADFASGARVEGTPARHFALTMRFERGCAHAQY